MPKKITDDGEIIDETTETNILVATPQDKWEFKTPHNHNTDVAAMQSATFCRDKSRTQQNTREEADINAILKKFGVGNVAAHLAQMPPSFLDVPETMDMHTVLEIHRAADEAFMALPADTREKFGNDLARYVSYVDDRLKAKDLNSLAKLGLDVTAAQTAAKALQEAEEQRETLAFNEKVAKAQAKAEHKGENQKKSD